jgi:hypothetical protein
MPKPKWAPDNGGVGCGQTRFLGIWRANKKRMQKSGYSVRKSDTGEWQVRFIPRHEAGWPPINPKTVFIDKKFKRSLCFECGKGRPNLPERRAQSLHAVRGAGHSQ